MKKTLIASLAIFGLVVFVGCSDSSKNQTSQTEQSRSETADKQSETDSGLTMVDSAGENWATVKGTVLLSGDVPEGTKKPIPSSHQQSCDLPAELHYQRYDVQKDSNAVKDVVVFLEGVEKSIQSEMPPKQVTIDQKNCQFHPSDTFLLRTGGTAKVLNSDPTLHNFRYKGENSLGMSGNKNQPGNGDPIKVDFGKTDFVSFKCNIHPWMNGMLRTADHHAYALTDKTGKFSFQVPPGTYTLKLRHIGMKEAQTLEVDVKENKTWEQKITLNPSP